MVDSSTPSAGDVFARAFELAPIGMTVTAADGRWLEVNRAYADMLGYTPAELLGRSWADVTHPEDLDLCSGEYRQLLAGAIERFRVEKRYLHRDGHVVWADLSVSLLPDVEGRPRRSVAQILDITHRKRSEELLRRRDAVLAAVAWSAGRLLSSERWEDAIDEALRRLGEAADVSRAYVFRVAECDGARTAQLLHEWCAAGVTPRLGDPRLDAVPLLVDPNDGWVAELDAGHAVQTHAGAVAGGPVAPLAAAGFQSLLAVPVLASETRWGSICFDECRAERVWEPAEVEALRAAAGAIGAAVERAASEASRQQSEERHVALIERLPLVTYIDRADDNISGVYVSPQIERVLGYTPEQWTSDPDFFSKVIHPDDRGHALDGSWPEGEGPHAVEYRLIAADGRVVWIHDQYFLVPGHDASDVGYSQGFMLDITERREAEEALRRRDAVLDAVAASAERLLAAHDWRDAVPELLYTLGEATQASRVYLFERHEVEAAEVVSQRFEWCAPGVGTQLDRPAMHGLRTDSPGFRDVLDDLRAGRTVQGHARELAGPMREELEAQSIRSLLLVPLVVEGGWWGFVGFDECRVERTFASGEVDALRAAAGILSAAISRQAAEERRRAAETQYRTLVETSPAAIVVVDLDGRVTLWNGAAEAMYGWRASEVVGRPLPIDGADEAQVAGWGAGARVTETRRLRKDGTPVDVRLSLAPVHDAAGTLVGVLGVHVDETERKALEAQLAHSQRMEAVGRLAGGIAHDFNNLLTAIQGYAAFLEERLVESDDLRRDAEEISRAAERAAALVRQLLAFSRKQVLRPEVVNLNDVVREMESMLRRLIGEDVVLTTRLDPSLASVSADPAQLEQTVVNLVVNALDAMPEGGSLTISTRNVHIGEVPGARDGVAPGRYVRLAVEDTGTGMDERTRARAFEPFFTTKELGSGLGLASVFGTVTQTGGHVEIESEPGEGTAVVVLLPAVGTVSNPSLGAPRGPGSGQGAETVLLVEDEDVVRGLTRRILADAGYTVLEASSGDDALRVAEEYEGRIDLVLTDVVMPGMGGLQLSERLHALRPRTPVVFMSGYNEDALGGRGVEDDRYVAKPFTSAELTAAVRDALDETAAASTAA
jgi:PAS domain S-box-containing protein